MPPEHRGRWSSKLMPSAAVLAVALVVAGCGSDKRSSASSTGTTSQAASTSSGTKGASVSVRETEYKLSPATPSISKKGVVEFKVQNAGKVTHALAVEGPNGEAKTSAIQAGSSATLKVNFNKPGKYEWYCPIDGHKGLGMKGEFVVGGAPGGSSSGGTDTSGSSSSGSGGGY